MIRKIVRVGASLCLLLPKDVIKTMEWDFGDQIDLILDEENEKVVLRNPKEESKEKQTYMEYFDDFLNEYQEALSEIEPNEELSN
ncbi:MAG: hypothetical protein H8D42_01000 [Candidatus Marinimicrobia bacterium]|nr:hypothetical protein [Candidatus Neomarinimicrobiota bacterium]MBL7067809.1 hypothetical protein [Candidatus Neomarinimicrobiota bacterium]